MLWWGGVVAVFLQRQRIGDAVKGRHHACQARLYLRPGMNCRMQRNWPKAANLAKGRESCRNLAKGRESGQRPRSFSDVILLPKY